MSAATQDSKFRWHEALLRAALPDKAKLVALKLWDYTNADGRNAYPGNRRLADDLGISERTVIRSLTLLREQGWIVRTSTANRSGSRTLSDVVRARRGCGTGDTVLSLGPKRPGDK